MGKRPSSGHCFEVAAGLVVGGVLEDLAAEAGRPLVLNEKSEWRVVHGLPVGRAGMVADRRYWHAWVELSTPAGVLVLQEAVRSADELIQRVPRAAFYALGRLDDAHLWRFTPAEARRELRRWRHCGPWVKGWEQMGDGDWSVDDPRYASDENNPLHPTSNPS